MGFNKCFIIALCLINPLIANEDVEPMLYTEEHDFINIEIKKQADPLSVHGILVVTATVMQKKLSRILSRSHYSSVSIDDVEPCFFINYKTEDFKIISGMQEGNCELFDSSGKAQKIWVLEAIRPGFSYKKINISIGWKYINGSEKYQIYPGKDCFLEVRPNVGWLFFDWFSENAYKLATFIVALLALINSLRDSNAHRNSNRKK